MKGLIGFILLAVALPVSAQYYYKDIIITRQAMEKRALYKKAQVRVVNLKSFEADGQPTEGFAGEQKITSDYSQISTITGTNTVAASNLISYYDQNGLLLKTVDTSDTYQSITEYKYDLSGRITNITNTSLETDNQVKDMEQHQWNFDQAGKPLEMIKIKNGLDTTVIQFKPDDKGNVSEEMPIHKGKALPSTYYYYDSENRLTDIVRYSARAQRLLPDYLFEYDAAGHLSSSLIVREGSSQYQKWLYEYNDKGLALKEICYGKGNELLGRIEYEYKY